MVADGGSKPPHIPPPHGKPSAAAGGAAAGAGAGGSLAAWWQKVTGHAGEIAKEAPHHVSRAAYTVRSRASGMKWSMPVDVKIDFLRPAIETVRETAIVTWYNLPPQVQQAAPFVGVAVGSGLVMFLVQQRRVNFHRRHGEELTLQVKTLKKEKEELVKRINLLKARSGSPRSEVEARMASAVAEATNAAAAAADAAARAATACIYQRPPLSPALPSFPH